ncbi:RNA polymerase sigma-70 factor [Olivibacter sp. SA151]|uniref:RNA polymerase sigma factor n=1 Tax=Olivibacter jilunii TaxID=985016 RepID=UPI003F18E225
MSSSKLTDLELWLAVKRSDQRAFSFLYDRYWSKIYTTSYRYLRDKELAANVVHDVFTSLWLRRDALMIQSFEAYVTRATKYIIFRNLSQLRKNLMEYEDDLERKLKDDTTNRGEERLVQDESMQLVQYYLSALPARCQEIFSMSRFDQLSNEEIAQQLGISKRTVENQLTYALKHLRMHLKELSIICLFLLVS